MRRYMTDFPREKKTHTLKKILILLHCLDSTVLKPFNLFGSFKGLSCSYLLQGSNRYDTLIGTLMPWATNGTHPCCWERRTEIRKQVL